MNAIESLLAPMPDAVHREVGGVRMDVVKVGLGRVKRVIYPPGFRWSTHMKPQVGTESCMHAHAGFLASGRMKILYPDGCAREYSAPQIIAVEPGHDGWVVGEDPAVLIEFDFESETAVRLGMPQAHTHG